MWDVTRRLSEKLVAQKSDAAGLNLTQAGTAFGRKPNRRLSNKSKTRRARGPEGDKLGR